MLADMENSSDTSYHLNQVERARRHLKAGNQQQCARILKKLLTSEELDDETLMASASLAHELGANDAALEILTRVALESEERNSRVASRAIEWAPASLQYDARTAAFIARLLNAPGVAPESLFHATFSYLSRFAPIAAYLHHPAAPDGSEDMLSVLGSSPLFISLVGNAIAANPNLEMLLIMARRGLVMLSERRGAAALIPHGALIVALARQSFLSEYCQSIDDEDRAGCHGLDALLRQTGPADSGYSELLSLRAVFGPLADMGSGVQHQSIIELPNTQDDFHSLWREQVEEPRIENTIAANIPHIGEISDHVSKLVRAQYEESPYPRWSRTAYQAPRSFADELSQQLPALPREAFADLPTAPTILIAGGGTGQHPIPLAGRLPTAQIEVIDLSLSSLAYAKRKATERDLTNIEFFQADILDLGGWDRQFDVIESMGVLHHMADPIAGWRILTGLLRPGGWMKIGLYSQIARGFVRKARAYIEANHIPATSEGVRAFRHEILARGDDHPLAPLAKAYDFYSLSNCRDMFFHVQEHQFTIPQISAAIEELGVDFMGFQLASAQWYHGYRQRFPSDSEQRDLENWTLYEVEEPRIFATMYAFWLRKPTG